jgi:phosphate transport system protein
MVLRIRFMEELSELHKQLVEFASFVEESIDRTIIALKSQDIELAARIISDDDIADEMEKKIERMCLNLIAKHQPLAQDLRTISTTLKILTDLERIADHSSDIAELTVRLSKEHYIKPLVDIPKMANVARKMVTNSINSFINNDQTLAAEVCKNDDEVDSLFNIIVLELISLMKDAPNKVEQCIDLMFIAKYLERMGDHATNIAEWAIYNITGEHVN